MRAFLVDMSQKVPLALAAMLSFPLAACSVDLTTRGKADTALRVDCFAVSNGKVATIETRVSSTKQRALTLGETDRFVARGSTGETPLKQFTRIMDADGDILRETFGYQAAVAPDSTFSLALLRGDAPAHWMKLELPPPLVLSLSGGPSPRLTWEPAPVTSRGTPFLVKLWVACSEKALSLPNRESAKPHDPRRSGELPYGYALESDRGNMDLAELMEKAKPRKGGDIPRRLQDCKEISIVASRIDVVRADGLGLARDSVCQMEQIRTLQLPITPLTGAHGNEGNPQ